MRKEEHKVKKRLKMDIRGKRKSRRPMLGWKYTCQQDIKSIALREGRETDIVTWRKRIISNTDGPRRRKPGYKKKTYFIKIKLLEA